MDISHPSSGMRKNTIILLHLPGTQSTSYQGNKYALPSSFLKKYKKVPISQKKKLIKKNPVPLLYTYHAITSMSFAILHLLVRAVIKSCAHLFCTFRALEKTPQQTESKITCSNYPISEFLQRYKVFTSQKMQMNVLTLRQKLSKFKIYFNGS